MIAKRSIGAAVVSLGAIGAALYVFSGSNEVSAQAQPDAAARALRQMQVGGSVPVDSDIIAGVRSFEAGNKTYWHSHAGGFILFVQEGRARVQTRGGLMRELGPGEVDYTPPGVEHWHGAAPDTGMLQLGVIPFGGGIEFLEPVTDAQYDGEAR